MWDWWTVTLMLRFAAGSVPWRTKMTRLESRQFSSSRSSVGGSGSDPHVFGPHGSGSISQRYGSGSGSFPFLRLK
jgi:hypothetical protein